MALTARSAALLGAIVAALIVLPGLGIGTLWDNSETAYGEVAREILYYRDPVVLHLNGTAWFVQPPFWFWLAAACAKLFGTTAFALRLPAALSTIALGGIVAYGGARLRDPQVGLLASVVLSTSLMHAVLGRLAVPDASLDLCVVLGILASVRALQEADGRAWLVACGAVGVGTLVKGPVAPVVVGLVVVPWALLERRFGAAPRSPKAPALVLGVALALAIVAPWCIAEWRAVGSGAFATLIGHYTFGRYVGTIESQSGPLWYYVPTLILGFAPWTAFLVPALLHARTTARAPDGALARLALLWLVVPFVFFSLAQTKLPNYLALAMPGPALLAAAWITDALRRDRRRALLAWAALAPIAVLLVGVGAVIFVRHNRLTSEFAGIVVALQALGVFVLVGWLAAVASLRRRRSAVVGPYLLAATSGAFLLVIACVVEPQVERFKPVPPLAAVLRAQAGPHDAIAIDGVAGSYALTFYSRPVVRTIGDDLAPAICGVPRAFVLTARRNAAARSAHGRRRRIAAEAGKDALVLYDGPPCAAAPEAAAR